MRKILDENLKDFLKLTNKERKELFEYYFGNYDINKLQIKDNIKKLYSLMLIDSYFANDLFSLIISNINLEDLENLSNKYYIYKIDNLYIIRNENLIYIFDINTITNLEQKIYIQSHLEEKIKLFNR